MSIKSSRALQSPSIDNTALIVVSYNPDKNFITRMADALSQFPAAFILDNSTIRPTELTSLASENVEVIFNENNIGLGNALNQGCERALEQGFEWSVTLDQDTELNPNYLERMITAWELSYDSTVLLGCNYFNVSRSSYKASPFNQVRVERRKTVITSGCLMHLPTWSKIGKFRGEFFIDSIDHELCLRARRAGYNVAFNYQSNMRHTIGDTPTSMTYLAKFMPYRHCIWRSYTRTRNSMRTIIEYGLHEPAWCIKKILGIIVEFLSIILLERDKIPRLRAFGLGLSHGIKGNLGPVPRKVFDLQN